VSWTFAHEGRVHLVWLALAIVGGLAALELRGRGSLGTLLSPVMQRRLVVRPGVARTVVRLALVLVALVAGVVALMRPQAHGETIDVSGGKTSADVIVVLDVSKSMLAEDARPNRLERAKAEIRTMAGEMTGYRLGLVAFAGRAALLCPLTSDRAFFDLVLEGIDTRSVSKGGTRIGDALRTATKAFPAGPGAKLIVLLTDGEDHDSGPVDAAKEAAAAGVRVVAIGLGSEAGSPVMITDSQTNEKKQMMHDGQPVISKIDGPTLGQIASTTEGIYVPVETEALDLKSILEKHITPMVTEEQAKTQRYVPEEEYPWMVLLAMLALIAAAAVGGVRRNP
jgi:Ca-activated chloride channel family protein